MMPVKGDLSSYTASYIDLSLSESIHIEFMLAILGATLSLCCPESGNI